MSKPVSYSTQVLLICARVAITVTRLTDSLYMTCLADLNEFGHSSGLGFGKATSVLRSFCLNDQSTNQQTISSQACTQLLHCSSSSIFVKPQTILKSFILCQLAIFSESDVHCACEDDSHRGAPLPEGGIRFAIHPVSGLLLTTENQPSSEEASSAPPPGHKPQRVDRFIIKVSARAVLASVVCFV